MDRNKNLHEGKSYSKKEAASYVRHYLGEIDGLNERQISDTQQNDKWKVPVQSTIKIDFDAAFDDQNHQSASAIVVRNYKGEIKATKSYLHSTVAMVFEAEAITCYEAVLTRKDMEFTDTLVEEDSKIIINKCITQSRDKSQRLANQLAHIIATTSLRKDEEIYLFCTVPRYATHQSGLERPREPD
ncbi:hypothetical protein GOBAR_AA16889 [Gossypium barbadense]|uniref:RNase H type-1 domain-containing protein n=1 Tax=Gossypium barbadense TaxID=3634 RepID=A0A2P5WKY0_GOSBA|nr:hypothetical protein GOBAR_AA28943 [Gossypium barbadense]PPS03774.1 hypothetical protein GOBAR_AA16889 [Gossypium barbadense]